MKVVVALPQSTVIVSDQFIANDTPRAVIAAVRRSVRPSRPLKHRVHAIAARTLRPQGTHLRLQFLDLPHHFLVAPPFE